MSTATQKEMVLKHLKRRSLTSWDAIMHYGVTRLADVVFKLKSEGYHINTKIESAEGKRWAKYSLIKGKKNGLH